MECKIVATYTLNLNKKEALWLKNYVQNAFKGGESEIDQQMREMIFNALPDTRELF